jgi:hypothetical protein
MTLAVGNVVELRARGGAPGNGYERRARAGIVWKVERDSVLWVPIANARVDDNAFHRADILVTDMADHAAAGFPMPRPMIECRKLLRAPLAVFERRPVLGNIPPALMARIAAMQVREARQLSAEIRLGNLTPQNDTERLREAA